MTIARVSLRWATTILSTVWLLGAGAPVLVAAGGGWLAGRVLFGR